MLSTYEVYQQEPKSLTLEEMAALHRQIVEETGRGEEALGFYRELLTAAVKYLESCSNWSLWGWEEKAKNDRARTLRHNKAIIAFDMLAGYLKLRGKSALWRDALGDEKDPDCRKRIGDFACYLAFVESLNAK